MVERERFTWAWSGILFFFRLFLFFLLRKGIKRRGLEVELKGGCRNGQSLLGGIWLEGWWLEIEVWLEIVGVRWGLGGRVGGDVLTSLRVECGCCRLVVFLEN